MRTICKTKFKKVNGKKCLSIDLFEIDEHDIDFYTGDAEKKYVKTIDYCVGDILYSAKYQGQSRYFSKILDIDDRTETITELYLGLRWSLEHKATWLDFAAMIPYYQKMPMKNPLQTLESMVSANLSGIYRGVISKEVSDDHEFIIVKPKPHRGGIPFGVKPTPEQLERILRKELARQKALEEKEKKKPTMADILIGNIRALRNYAQKVYEAHRDGEYTISDTQKAEIDKQLEKKDKVINKLKKHW